jgi:hypothetical protein
MTKNFMERAFLSPRWLSGFIGIWILLGSVAWAGEFQVQAQLVWGTDTGRPEGKDFEELDGTIRERFLRQLRWKNYYVVRTLASEVPEKESKQLALSKRCSVDVKRVGEGEVELKIHSLKEGESPKLVKTDRISIEKLEAGHALVFGGDSKDNWDDAWFVVLTAAKK